MGNSGPRGRKVEENGSGIDVDVLNVKAVVAHIPMRGDHVGQLMTLKLLLGQIVSLLMKLVRVNLAGEACRSTDSVCEGTRTSARLNHSRSRSNLETLNNVR